MQKKKEKKKIGYYPSLMLSQYFTILSFNLTWWAGKGMQPLLGSCRP